MYPERGAFIGLLVAAITALCAVAVVIGSFAGMGLGVVALFASGVLCGTTTILALGISRAARGQLARARGASTDPVTGFADAEKLHRDLVRSLDEVDSYPQRALYVCALHGLKKYNDAYGDACGDALLAWLARKLSLAIGSSMRGYRMRGGSFALLAEGDERARAEARAAAMSALQEVGEGFMISCSLGEALLTETQTAEEAIEVATRRAQASRSRPQGQAELYPPRDPIEALQLVGPRYDVAGLAVRIGRRMGVPVQQLKNLEAAAHLRDVGNMAVPSAVLSRAGELPGHEWEFILLHTVVGERLLAANFGMEEVAKLVRSSHERWDGSGYPDGLRAQQIPLGSRIVFVCSAFEDMTSERPHRPAMIPSAALAELRRGAGSQFDPKVVQAFEAAFAAMPPTSSGKLIPPGTRLLRVLVADDDAASRFLLARGVQAAGHECAAIGDGIDALARFAELEPQVVICDWLLPGIGAAELCRQIRKHPAGESTFFVALVALDAGDHVWQALQEGADDFLVKPFDREDLRMLLDAAQARPARPAHGPRSSRD